MNKKLPLLSWQLMGVGILLLSSTAVLADISGKIFRDFNANGTFDTGASFNEVGMAGVTVKAFAAADPASTPSATATSGSDGTYTLTGLSSGADYRIEYSWVESWLKPGAAGGTSVQFVKDGVTGVNVAVSNPAQYCQASPDMALPAYNNGSGAGSSDAAFLKMPYSASGTTAVHVTASQAKDMGATWGNAYRRSSKQIFASAFLKRHAGLGPRGLDGVYVIDNSAASPVLAGGFDLQGVVPANGGVAIDLGSVNRKPVSSAISAGAAGNYDLPADKTKPSVDLDAFGKVAKVGFGGIDFSEDEKTLWLVNLNQRALIAVDTAGLSLVATTPNTPSAGSVRQYPIASMSGVPTCSAGELRPFGLKFHNGKGYLGAVCDAATSATVKKPAELKAYVLSFDPATPAALTTELSFGLDYKREPAYQQLSGAGFVSGEWQKWLDTWDPTQINGGFWVFATAPQPVLANIEFDGNGSMILGFMDRFAHQAGWTQYAAISADRGNYAAVSAGDIIHAGQSGGTYVPELGAHDPGNAAAGFLTNDSAGNAGEYFFADFYKGFDASHHETALGGLAFINGLNKVAAVSYDPEAFNSQGLRWLNTDSGAQDRDYQIMGGTDISNFGKGAALGDVEVLCDPAPTEIGNRVWLDKNSNGIQDADEAGIDGVDVKLVCGTDSATVKTANGGQYLFSNATGGNATFMKAGTSCNIQVDSTQAPVKAYSLTAQNADAATDNNPTTDLRDSDAVDKAGTAEIAFTVGNAGENNHTLDIGYRKLPSVDVALTKQVAPSSAKRGDTVVYTLTATNTGADAATGVVVTDKLPAGLTLSTSTVPVASSGTFSDGVWNVGTLAAKAEATLTITATVQ